MFDRYTLYINLRSTYIHTYIHKYIHTKTVLLHIYRRYIQYIHKYVYKGSRTTACIHTYIHTIAVPSLRRDSPTIRMVNLGDAPALFNNATTATGSVADRIEPSYSTRSIPKMHIYTYIHTYIRAYISADYYW